MSEINNSNPLEQEIAQIEQSLAAKRAALEMQKQSELADEAGQAEMPHEKETLHEVIGEKIDQVQDVESVKPVEQSAPITDAGSAAVQPAPPVVEPPSYLSPELKDQVQNLVNLAFTKSIDDAIKQAKAKSNSALIDAFHDALVDELYNQLVERGKLNKI